MRITREKMKNTETKNKNLIKNDLCSRGRSVLEEQEKDNNQSGFQETVMRKKIMLF